MQTPLSVPLLVAKQVIIVAKLLIIVTKQECVHAEQLVMEIVNKINVFLSLEN
jgi:hypothetical protein